MAHPYSERAVVVYEKQKHGPRPGPRAHDVRPEAAGDSYAYLVDKFWVVESRDATTGRLRLRTPTGKLHEVHESDPSLRRPTWRERLWLLLRERERLRALLAAPSAGRQHE